MAREGLESFEEIQNCQLLDKYNLTDRKVPCITIKGRNIRFNMNALHLLHDTQYVQMLVNTEEKYMLVVPADKNDVNAFDWCKISKSTNKVEPKDITSKFFSPKMYKLMDWSQECSYKVQCYYQKFDNGKELLFFDLTEYVTLVHQEEETALGVKRKRTRPYYLASWVDSFGPPLQKIMNKVNQDFSGYYVVDQEQDTTDGKTFERNSSEEVKGDGGGFTQTKIDDIDGLPKQ